MIMFKTASAFCIIPIHPIPIQIFDSLIFVLNFKHSLIVMYSLKQTFKNQTKGMSNIQMMLILAQLSFK